MNIETKHQGLVRGGIGTRARLHLSVRISSGRPEEMQHWEDWVRTQGLESHYGVLSISARSQFAILPSVIAEAMQRGYMLAVEVGGVGGRLVFLHEAESSFWKMIAMAQAYRE